MKGFYETTIGTEKGEAWEVMMIIRICDSSLSLSFEDNLIFITSF